MKLFWSPTEYSTVLDAKIDHEVKSVLLSFSP
jgi:hypothetical protein